MCSSPESLRENQVKLGGKICLECESCWVWHAWEDDEQYEASEWTGWGHRPVVDRCSEWVEPGARSRFQLDSWKGNRNRSRQGCKMETRNRWLPNHWLRTRIRSEPDCWHRNSETLTCMTFVGARLPHEEEEKEARQQGNRATGWILAVWRLSDCRARSSKKETRVLEVRMSWRNLEPCWPDGAILKASQVPQKGD